MKKVMMMVMIMGMFCSTFSMAEALTNNTAIKVDAIEKSVENMVSVQKITEASGWGLQIATALKGCMSALNDGVTMTTDQVYKFSDSRLGKITTAIIVYKVVGKEILRLLIGIPLLIVLIVYSIKWLKRYLATTLDKDGEKTGIFYDLMKDSSDSACGAVVILAGTLAATFLAILMVLNWMF